MSQPIEIDFPRAGNNEPALLSGEGYFMFNLFKRLRGKPKNAPKIFVIGFNKCGTKTLHGFFSDNGIRSAHCTYQSVPDKKKTRIATTMRDNVEAGRPILSGMEHYQAFSDLITLSDEEVIEANSYFGEMHREYDNAFFIFNDRPVDDWIQSRVGHEGGAGGSLIGRYASASDLSRDAVIDLWRQQYADHKNAVLKYFRNNPRFLHFHLGEDGPEELARLFGEEIPLRLRHWRHRGSAQQRARNQKRA
jgi:hypothetical protein